MVFLQHHSKAASKKRKTTLPKDEFCWCLCVFIDQPPLFCVMAARMLTSGTSLTNLGARTWSSFAPRECKQKYTHPPPPAMLFWFVLWPRGKTFLYGKCTREHLVPHTIPYLWNNIFVRRSIPLVPHEWFPILFVPDFIQRAWCLVNQVRYESRAWDESFAGVWRNYTPFLSCSIPVPYQNIDQPGHVCFQRVPDQFR